MIYQLSFWIVYLSLHIFWNCTPFCMYPLITFFAITCIISQIDQSQWNSIFVACLPQFDLSTSTPNWVKLLHWISFDLAAFVRCGQLQFVQTQWAQKSYTSGFWKKKGLLLSKAWSPWLKVDETSARLVPILRRCFGKRQWGTLLPTKAFEDRTGGPPR